MIHPVTIMNTNANTTVQEEDMTLPPFQQQLPLNTSFK